MSSAAHTKRPLWQIVDNKTGEVVSEFWTAAQAVEVRNFLQVKEPTREMGVVRAR